MNNYNLTDMEHVSGRLTIHGILVDNLYYSCSHAILNQWFLPENDSKTISLLRKPSTTNLYYRCEETDYLLELHLISLYNSLSPQEILIYHAKLNHLKTTLKNLKIDSKEV